MSVRDNCYLEESTSSVCVFSVAQFYSTSDSDIALRGHIPLMIFTFTNARLNYTHRDGARQFPFSSKYHVKLISHTSVAMGIHQGATKILLAWFTFLVLYTISNNNQTTPRPIKNYLQVFFIPKLLSDLFN